MWGGRPRLQRVSRPAPRAKLALSISSGRLVKEGDTRKMRQWPSPGRTRLHVGRVKSASRKRNACPAVDGASNMRGFVTTLKNPWKTNSERANGSGPEAQ